MEEVRRILVVDDLEADRLATRFILEQKSQPGYVIEEVDRGELAVAACESFQPDCVLLDFRLPDTSGLDLLGLLRRRFGPLKFAIVMMTGSGHEMLAVRALKTGAQDYIPKRQLTSTMLERAIETALDKLRLERGRQEAEEALAASERKLREIINAAPCALFTVDMLEGRSVYVSGFAEKLIGYTAPEIDNLGGAGLLRLVHPEDRAVLQSYIKKVRLGEDGDILECEFRIQPKDAAWKWLSIRGHVVSRDAGGMASIVAGAASDISHRRQMEEELRESEMRLVVAQKAAGIATWAWEQFAGTIACSPLCMELYGRSDAEPLSRNLWGDWVHADDRASLNAELTSGWDGKAFEAEYRVILPDGSVRWLRSQGRLVNQQGKPPRLFGASLDVTANKKAEAELRRSNEDLERFAYVASHDLREPLRTIMSFSELLARRNTNLDFESAQFLEFIQQGGRRLQALTSDLLTFSRVTQAGQEPMEQVQGSELLEEALSGLRVLIKESSARVEADELPTLTVNFQQFTQLLQNLIGNAIKYRGERSPVVSLSAARRDHDWLFCVADNGIGFDVVYAEQIFEAFKRLHSRDQFSGTGLGLAICKRIVERHGGRIWAESEPGVGSKFFFTISDPA